jgi:hypothetical protein
MSWPTPSDLAWRSALDAVRGLALEENIKT